MKTRDLTALAALSEIIGTIAVVVSLIFVAYSINRNSAQLQAQNDDFLVQLQDDMFSDISLNPGLAEIVRKHDSQEELSTTEALRYRYHMYRALNAWEVAFVRHQNGFLGETAWDAWDASFADDFADQFPRQWWVQTRLGFEPAFAAHVDKIYERSNIH